MQNGEIKKIVRDGYGKIAAGTPSCCGPDNKRFPAAPWAEKAGKKMGYSDEEMGAVPDGANMGLGCGNPVALAALREGDMVLDLGSGAGFDCFLAAQRVGPTGKVVGVDMTPEMIARARENARKGDYGNVEFRQGDIENLPARDLCFDVVLSNCVVNLAPDKDKVFGEAFRVLKPGGRLMISDLVLLRELPESVRETAGSYIACIAGASMKGDYLHAIRSAGFDQVTIVDSAVFHAADMQHDPAVRSMAERLHTSPEAVLEISRAVESIKVQAVKPA